MIDISSSLNSVLKFKDQVPIFKIEVYDTVNTVPSVGLSGYYYATPTGIQNADGGDRPAPYWAQQDAIMSFNWDNGVPLNLSPTLDIGDQYSVAWFGKFYAEEAGQYRFDAQTGVGATRFVDTQITIDGTIVNTSDQMAEMTFPKNTWHDITLTYAKPAACQESAVSFFYRAPRDVGFRLLSADVLSDTSAFLTPTLLSGVTSWSVDVNQNQATVATFQIDNIQNNSQFTWSDSTQSFGVLKPNRLVKIYAGYLTANGEEYVQQFIGSIDSVMPNHSPNGIALSVSCRDFSRQLIETIVENFPNKASYLNPIQMKNGPYERPLCYDKWLIRDAVIDLCLKANIDPSYLKDRIDKRMAYRLQWDAAAYPKDYVGTMNKTFNLQKYPRPYLFQFTYGEKVYDKLLYLSDLVGFQFFFDSLGNVVFQDPRNEYRIEHYEADIPIFLEGNINQVKKTGPHRWTDDARTANGAYTLMNPNLNGLADISFTFEGVGCSLFYVKSTNGDTNTAWEIYRADGQSNQLVTNGSFDSSGAAAFQQEQVLTNALAKGRYLVRVYNSNPSKSVGIEALNVYQTHIFTPVYTFRDTQDILSLGYQQQNEEIRNDILVVGQPAPEGRKTPYGRSVDLNSITDPSATNYIGRRAVFVLKEPTISDTAHLQWLSENILTRYRRRHRLLEHETIGIPHLEPGDPIAILDTDLNIDTTTKNSSYDENAFDLFWIESFRTEMTKMTYKTNFKTSTYPPLRSWRPALRKPSVVIEGDGSVKFQPWDKDKLVALFSNFSVSPNPVDPLTGTTIDTVQISFDIAAHFKKLYVEIYNNDGSRPVAVDLAENVSTLPGTVTVIWDLIDANTGQKASDGTYRIYIYGTITDNLGDDFPLDGDLFPEGLFEGKNTGKPNLDYVFKNSGSIPTVTLTTPAEQHQFQFIPTLYGTVNEIQSNLQDPRRLTGDIYLAMNREHTGCIRHYNVDVSQFAHSTGHSASGFEDAFNLITADVTRALASFSDQRAIFPQCGNGFHFGAVSNRSGYAIFEVHRVNRAVGSATNVTGTQIVWTERLDLDQGAINVAANVISFAKFGQIFGWNGATNNGQATNPEVYIACLRIKTLNTPESGFLIALHKTR